MRTIDSSLKQDFKDGYRSILVKVTTESGDVFGYTDHDMPLTVSGIIYVPAPGLVRGNMSVSSTEQVSNQEFSTAWIDAPEEDLLAGKFDNAKIDVLLCSWKQPNLGAFVVNSGNLGQIQWTSDGFSADVLGFMRVLQRSINFLVTGTCRHQLFSQYDSQHIGACTLNSVSYTKTSTVASITTDKLIITAASANLWGTTGTATNGILTWTSGLNNGLKREVKNYTVSGATATIEFFLPTDYDISNGDAFSLTAGCDKKFDTCKSKFNNVINFGGFPHIQTEVQYR